MAHICKKCFLREMAEEDAKMIEKRYKRNRPCIREKIRGEAGCLQRM